MAYWLFSLLLLSTPPPSGAAPAPINPPGQVQGLIESQPITLMDLTGVWLQHTSDNRTFAQQHLDDRQWSPIILPKPGGQQRQFPGKVQWYRRHFFLTPTQIIRSMSLYLGSLRDIGEIYINDQLLYSRGALGQDPKPHEPWLLPIHQTIPQGWLHAGDNVLAIRVADLTGGSGLPTGPMWLGETGALEVPSLPQIYRWLELRTMLVWLSWFTGGLLWLLYGLEGLYGLFACFSIGILLADGTGLLWHWIPNTTFAAVLPFLAQPILNYSLLRSMHTPSLMQRNLPIWLMERFSLLHAVVLLLLPHIALLPFHPTLQSMVILISLLLLAKELARSMATRKSDTLLFAGNLVLIGVLLYQYLIGPTDSLWPQPFAWTAFLVLFSHTLIKLWRTLQLNTLQHQTIQANVFQQSIDKERDALIHGYRAFAEPVLFLQAVVQDIALRMDVRKSSILLPDETGQLRIAAARGLSIQAQFGTIPKGASIAYHVFHTGEPMKPSTLPTNLHPSQRTHHPYHYETQGFLAYPIVLQEKIMGVINVSDRSNGEGFQSSHESQLESICQQLAICLQGQPLRWRPPTEKQEQVGAERSSQQPAPSLRSHLQADMPPLSEPVGEPT